MDKPVADSRYIRTHIGRERDTITWPKHASHKNTFHLIENKTNDKKFKKKNKMTILPQIYSVNG